MRLMDLIRLGTEYLIAGCAAAVFITIALIVGYKFIYQKLLHGTKKISKWQALWLIAFVVYGMVLLGATFLSRGGFYTGSEIVPFFASYKEAWYQGRMGNVRNLIVNILLFVPFGFMLPLGIKRFRVFWKTGLVGLITTVLIEGLQLVTKRGIFECDDILNNLLGTMIGYGFFALVSWLFLEKKKKKTVAKMLACQLPLILCSLAIATACFLYEKQELGNLSVHYITKIPGSKFEIHSDLKLDTKEEKAFVYQVKKYSLQETRELAENILGKTGTTIHDNETDLYDDTVFYRGTGKHVSVDFKGGFYDYTDFDALYSETKLERIQDASEEEVREALGKLGVELPMETTFENKGDGQYTFAAKSIEARGLIYDGQLTCTYMEGGCISVIRNRIYACTPYKEYPLISQEQAFQEILAGKFRFYFGSGGKHIINMQDVSLGYQLDSKSFYQPVYFFDVTIEGKEYQIQIPAVK